jgi:serine phosphatase RsbU (regulator of sigma subunit)
LTLAPLGNSSSFKKRSLRRTLTWLMLAMLVGVAAPTLTAVAWMNYTTSHANLTWTRQQIRDGLVAKGSVLVSNHAIALRGLVSDNAFADVTGIVRGAVAEDPDLVYGLFLSNEGVPWVFVAPGVNADAAPDPNAWKILKIDEASLTKKERQIRHLDLFGQEIFEFAMPVIDAESGDLLGTIRYGISAKRTEASIAEARTRSKRDLVRTLQLLAGIVLVAMVVGSVVAVRQSRRITEPLLKLTGVARTIAAGDRDVRADIRSGDEIELLGGAFNQMVGDLNDSYRGLHEAKEQLQRMNETLESQVVERTEALTQALTEVWSEMDLARKVQTVLLPQRTELRDYEIAATMMPAEVVGGDYFDLIHAPQADWLLIGDVSGHGVTAGLGMMMVQTAVRSLVVGAATDAAQPSPSELLARVNRAVRTNLTAVSPDQYMTISALRIQGPNVVYSGMHESILIYRVATGVVERLQTQGMWLGLMEDISSELRDDTFRLNDGDLCLLYTDGLTETVIGENRRRLGVAQLMAHFGELAAQTNDVKTILGKITDLVKDGKIQDDITAMIVRYAPQTAQAAA